MATRRVSRKFTPIKYEGIYDGGTYAAEGQHTESKFTASPDDWDWNTVTVEMSRRDLRDLLVAALDSQRSVRNLDGIKRDRSVCNMIDARIEGYRQMLEFVEDSSKPPTPAPEPTYSLNV